MTSIKWRDREIRNPAIRAVAITCGVGIGTLAMVALVMLAIFGMMITLPFHPVLRLFGLRGFIRRDGNDVEYVVDASSFRRRT
mgnify:CR=1 FL=1